MVTRNENQGNAPNNDKSAPAFNMQGVRQELWSATDSDTDGENIWGDARQAQDTTSTAAQSAPRTVPDSLRPGTSTRNPFGNDAGNPWNEDDGQSSVPSPSGSKGGLEHVPTVLRPGGRQETNPFKRKPLSSTNTGQSATSSAPTTAPPAPPTNAFSQLQLNESEQSTNPWKPAVEERKTSLAPPSVNTIPDQGTGNNVWGSGAPSRQPSPNPRAHSPAIVSLPSEGESPGWDEDIVAKPALGHMPQKSLEEQEFSQDSHAWDDLAQLDKGKGPAAHAGQNQPRSGDGWDLIDHDPQPGPISRQSTWENFDEPEPENEPTKPEPQVQKPPTPTELDAAEVPAPALPPRTSEDAPPPQPPRTQSPNAANKNETYQIKNINWHDVSAGQTPRKSPILVQNVNGPCPLVALVNALTLTTPADLTNTVLVETLRSREQISLDLLLQAVFDELMSPRRTNPDVALPDVSELYAFLKSLQTGMNVNPRYIPTPELINSHKRTSLTHVHPSERGDLIPGTFEDTRDMKLYATFSIPLIHGWLPPKDDSVYEAFDRQASSYEDVQSLLFREEELEDKLSAPSSAGLTEQEQQIYQDIMNIKSFLDTWPTQLTPYGLDVITKSVRPGTFSILFRNDHFSTLYRHPQTLQLLVLVTDAGYHSHDELVWESLVDVNGERAEFFSGDFRLVGGPQHQQSHQENVGASTSGGSRGRRSTSDADNVPVSPTLEQEDRDLALALQLQEEEDERHRNEQAARHRERQLSEQFIEQQGRGGNARTVPRGRGGNSVASSRGGSTSQLNIPVRASSNSLNSPARGGRPAQQQPVRPLVPPANNRTHRPTDREDDDAPPSYEQASKAAPYVPPTGHPAHPESSPGSSSRGRRGNLAGGPSRVSLAGNNVGRGRPPPVAAQGADDRHKDCAVM
ncbi:hypothetical protein PG996_004655 [Apiospora saccharicola]|uniref:MINDY deubiquitinase domain-containing protein n=1 Tax=Apiospora saccharicola TaxID=335842 RepID=A0ABR1W7K4_9PEZI